MVFGDKYEQVQTENESLLHSGSLSESADKGTLIKK
jgi:hypothetical protein